MVSGSGDWFSEIELHAELCEPPLEDLGRPQVGVAKRLEVIEHGAHVQQVIHVEVRLQPARTKTEDLAPAEVQLIDAFAELRERIRHVDGHARDVSRQVPPQAWENLR